MHCFYTARRFSAHDQHPQRDITLYKKRSRVNIFDAQLRAYGEKKPLEGS